MRGQQKPELREVFPIFVQLVVVESKLQPSRGISGLDAPELSQHKDDIIQ